MKLCDGQWNLMRGDCGLEVLRLTIGPTILRFAAVQNSLTQQVGGAEGCGERGVVERGAFPPIDPKTKRPPMTQVVIASPRNWRYGSKASCSSLLPIAA